MPNFFSTNRIKPAAKSALVRSGLHQVIPRSWAGCATILTMHRICRDHRNQLAPSIYISHDFLEALVSHVLAKGYEIVTMDQLRECVEQSAPVKPRLVITFDDGYRDNMTLAAPILARHGLSWTLYITTGLIDRTADYWWGALERVIAERDSIEMETPRLRACFPTVSLAEKGAAFEGISRQVRLHGADVARYLAERYGVVGQELLAEDVMTWKELRELAEAPAVTLGGHAISHRALSTLSKTELSQELVGCRARILEMTGRTPRHFAPPFGAPETIPEDLPDLVRRAGFDTLALTRHGNVGERLQVDLYDLPRISLRGDQEDLALLDFQLAGANAVIAQLKTGFRMIT